MTHTRDILARLAATLTAAAAVALFQYPTVALAAGGGKGGEAGFDWGKWAFQLINFAIFAGIIIYYAAPAMRDYFEAKREDLRSDLREAERMREEAEAKVAEYEEKLDALEQEREALLEEYRQQGEREKERLIEDAKEQIEKMRDDAETTIDLEVRKAVADLEEQAVEMAVEMARDIARERLDTDQQHRLIDEYVNDLEDGDTRAAG